VILPLSRPVVATIAVFSFLSSWTDFLLPSIYLNSVEHYTLSLGLAMYQDLNNTDWRLVMAAAMFLIVPVLLVFFVAQRYFQTGI
jgi:multiple sugar transport system permease protein